MEFQIGKGVCQGCILSPCLFNLYAEYIIRNDTTLMAESEEELKSFLMKVEEKSGKSWLKTQHSENEDHGIRSHHFLANRWGNSGNNDRLLSGASTGVPTHDKGHAERPDMYAKVSQGSRGPPGPA